MFFPFLLSSLLLVVPVVDPLPLTPEHRQWLDEEVCYVISARERQHFLQAGSLEERESLFREFWRLRDPDPTTEENEYRSELSRRIEYANRHFHDGRPGWKTDRGRIYIMHGPPDSVSYSFGGSRMMVQVENPTEVLTMGLADRQRLFRVEFARPESEVWVYRHLEGARNVPSYFQVIFSRSDAAQLHRLASTLGRIDRSSQDYQVRLQRDLAISDYLNTQRTGGEFKIVYAGEYRYGDMDDFVQGIFQPGNVRGFSLIEYQAALADLERSPGDVLEARLERRRRLHELVATRISYDRFSLNVAYGAFRSPSGATALPVTVSIGSEYAGEKLEIAVELLRPDGTVAASDAGLLTLGDSRRQDCGAEGCENFSYQGLLTASPGSYKLLVYARLDGRGSVAFEEQAVELPSFGGTALLMSDVLFFDRVMSREEFATLERRSEATTGRPIFSRNHVLFPASDRTFRRKEELMLLFEVYNPSAAERDGKPHLEVGCRIWQGSKLVATIPEKQLEYFTETEGDASGLTRTSYGLSLPLVSFHPGDFELELEVLDKESGEKASKRADFSIN